MRSEENRPVDRSQLLKGVLDLAVLAVLAEKDAYGYDVVRRLRSFGLIDVAEASVYGTLRRLFATGYLSSYVVPSEEGPHRKYYGMTLLGRGWLMEQRIQWSDFRNVIDAIVDNAEITNNIQKGASNV